MGEAAVLFCFVFLYVAAAGPGAWSVDGARLRASMRQRPADRAKQHLFRFTVPSSLPLAGLVKGSQLWVRDGRLCDGFGQAPAER